LSVSQLDFKFKDCQDSGKFKLLVQSFNCQKAGIQVQDSDFTILPLSDKENSLAGMAAENLQSLEQWTGVG
jgi:hypothetical protein